jgi:hypothetical protein
VGSLVFRGTRDKPRVYAQYLDVDGTRRTRLLKGVRTKSEGWEVLAGIEARIREQRHGMAADEPPPPGSLLVGPLMRRWMEGLENRNAKLDRQRADKHLLPVWEKVTLDRAQKLPPVMEWLDDMKRAKALSAQSMRHNLNLLSRFFAWAIERGHAGINPVRQIPSGKRPMGAPKKDGPWIRDEETFWKLYEALPEPVR